MASFAIGMAGLVWMLPLMLHQFTFFPDAEERRIARESMALMPVAGALLLLGAVGLAVRVGAWHGLVASMPAVTSLSVAWALPDSFLQLLTYAITAPFALGALLSGLLPVDRMAPRWAAPLVAVMVGAAALMTTPFLALFGLVTGVTWWRLPARR